MNNRVKVFFPHWTWTAEYEFLEEGKKDEDLEKIAKKHNIIVPCHDIALFRCRYAMVDEENKNRCTLPEEEVRKALPTLTGKAIDISHFRKNTVGYWLEGSLIQVNSHKEIISYGAYWKGNFSEEYEDVKKRMKQGAVKVSFEAWGNRRYKNEDKVNYDLTDIEFAGGAILDKNVNPAFDDAELLEMSYHDGKILEFAKVMTTSEKFLHTGDDIEVEIEYQCECGKRKKKKKKKARVSCGEEKEICDCGKEMKMIHPENSKEELPEFARFYVYDTEQIVRLIGEVECLTCKEKGFYSISLVDFENSSVKFKCVNCQAIMTANLTPSAKLVKKGRKIKKLKLAEERKVNLESEISSIIEKIENSSLTTSELEQEIAKFPKQVTSCISKKVKSGIKSADAVKQCWRDFKKGNDETVGLVFVEEDILKILENFEGSEDELEEAFMNEIEYADSNIEGTAKLKYEERKKLSVDVFAAVETVKIKTGTKKIKMFPIHDSAHVRNALARLGQPKPQATLKKLGISIESIRNKILRRAKQLNMKTLLDRYKKGTVEEVLQEIAKANVNRELTKEELEKALSAVKSVFDVPKSTQQVVKDKDLNSLDDLKGKSTADSNSLNNPEISEEQVVKIIKDVTKADEKAKAEADAKAKAEVDAKAKKEAEEKAKAEKGEKIVELEKQLADANAKVKKFENEKAAEEKKKKDELIKSRKDELGEFAKDAKDEDVLDETKYENMKLKKALAAVNKGEKIDVAELIKGSTDKDTASDEEKSRKKVDEIFLGSDSSDKNKTNKTNKVNEDDFDEYGE